MTADTDIRNGLVAALTTIDGLTPYNHIPNRVNAPAAAVSRFRTNFDSVMARGADDFEYLITLFVSWADPSVAQLTMSRYLATSGADSIKAVLESDKTLGGVVDFVRVVEAREELIRQVGEIEFLTVEILVEVTA